MAGLLRPLVDQDLSLVFDELTTIGVVQTAEGLPIHHEVFEGNQAEAPTLLPTLRKVPVRFPHIKRLIVVERAAAQQVLAALLQPLDLCLGDACHGRCAVFPGYKLGC